MLAGSAVARHSTDPSYEIYAYTGREWDPEIGLYFYRARFYDPKIGRFISEDPIGIEGGVNPFAYVENDPANASDPEGLCPKRLDMGYEVQVIGPGPSAPGYQAEIRSRTIWFLVKRSGECCQQRSIECTYALVRNYQRRTRPFTAGHFGAWGPWTITPYRRFMEVTVDYNCDTGVMSNFRHRRT
jgi:RHS repeat-associated protein